MSWLMLAAGLWLLRADRYYQPFSLKLGLPTWAAQKELLRLGLPMGVPVANDLAKGQHTHQLTVLHDLHTSVPQRISASLIKLVSDLSPVGG
ncbi:multidrug resistance protein, partial [Alcaligenes faecalis subsp. faecalis NCIB 8687]